MCSAIARLSGGCGASTWGSCANQAFLLNSLFITIHQLGSRALHTLPMPFTAIEQQTASSTSDRSATNQVSEYIFAAIWPCTLCSHRAGHLVHLKSGESNAKFRLAIESEEIKAHLYDRDILKTCCKTLLLLARLCSPFRDPGCSWPEFLQFGTSTPRCPTSMIPGA